MPVQPPLQLKELLVTSLPVQLVTISNSMLNNQIDLVAVLQSAAATGAAATVGAAAGAAGAAAHEAGREKDRKRRPNN